jgi:hypothetical protein
VISTAVGMGARFAGAREEALVRRRELLVGLPGCAGAESSGFSTTARSCVIGPVASDLRGPRASWHVPANPLGNDAPLHSLAAGTNGPADITTVNEPGGDRSLAGDEMIREFASGYPERERWSAHP